MTDTEKDRVKAICEVAGVKEIDDLSDGFHTFRQLYYQRMMLFAAIVKQNRDKAWKSLRHEDGELCFGGGWFIVGIDTPEGSFTYHYEDNYYSLFDCEELRCAKHWDGHTEKDVTRLLSLPSAKPEPCEDAVSRKEVRLMCDRLLKMISDNGFYQSVTDLDAIEKAIKDEMESLPSVTPKLATNLQPTCNCEDAVSREEVIRLLHSNYHSKSMIEEVKDLPSVMPKPKTGKWITEIEDWRCQIVWIKCSECGFDASTKYKYCPNCGSFNGGEQG